jgi:hypothetical protein
MVSVHKIRIQIFSDTEIFLEKGVLKNYTRVFPDFFITQHLYVRPTDTNLSSSSFPELQEELKKSRLSSPCSAYYSYFLAIFDTEVDTTQHRRKVFLV